MVDVELTLELKLRLLYAQLRQLAGVMILAELALAEVCPREAVYVAYGSVQLLLHSLLFPKTRIHRWVASGMQRLRKFRRLAILAMLRVAGAQPLHDLRPRRDRRLLCRDLPC